MRIGRGEFANRKPFNLRRSHGLVMPVGRAALAFLGISLVIPRGIGRDRAIVAALQSGEWVRRLEKGGDDLIGERSCSIQHPSFPTLLASMDAVFHAPLHHLSRGGP